jgi:hypothetical protein
MVPTVSTFISCRPSWWLDDSTQSQICKAVGGISEAHEVSPAEHGPPGLPGHAYRGALAHCIEKEQVGYAAGPLPPPKPPAMIYPGHLQFCTAEAIGLYVFVTLIISAMIARLFGNQSRLQSAE